MLVAKGAYDGAPAWWLSLAFSGSSIVVAGAAENTPPYGTGLGATAVLARIADNGTPDPAFGNGGFVEFPGSNVTFASGHALAIDGRGRAVLGIWRATTTDFPGDVSAAVVRVTASGALDGTFGSGGQVLLGGLKGGAPLISLTRSGGIVALGAWAALTPGGTILVARLKPNGQLDPAFGTGGEVEATGVPPSNGALDCRGNLIVTGPGGLTRYGPDGRLDPSFKTPAAPPVRVGDTTGVPVFGLFAFAPGGRLVLAGGVNDGPSVIGGATQVGHSAIALARVAASCPIVDSRPPTVGLTCTTSCRRLRGTALDDPVGGGVRRVLLGVEQIDGSRCTAWNGRRFAALPCGQAAKRLVAVPLVRGVFRIPPLAKGHFVVRAEAVDRAGNRSRTVLRVNR